MSEKKCGNLREGIFHSAVLERARHFFFLEGMMRERTCFFTGHREIPEKDYETIRRRTTTAVESLIQKGVVYFGAGGALGFDTLAAQVVLDLKRKYPQIKLILILPCWDQDRLWSNADKRVYANIKAQADKVVYTSEQYTKGCMHKRNRHLVDNSGYGICYLTKEEGGTFYTVNYAKSANLPLINVANE